MRRYKMIFALICTLCMFLTAFPFSASALVFNDGDFGFEMNPFSQTVCLVKYYGNDTQPVVPTAYSSYPLTKLSKKAFSGNAVIENVILPASLNSVEENSFAGCSSLISQDISYMVNKIGEGVFLNCSNLETSHFSASVDSLPRYTYAGCRALTSVSLSNSIVKIGDYAFQDCTSLVNLDFLTTVSEIGKNAFDGTGVVEFTIPSNVVELPEYSFANCKDLIRVNIPTTVTSISSSTFLNDPNIVLGVYYHSYAYQYAIDNSIPYILLDNVLLGDADGDGSVNVSDVTTIQRYLAELETLEGIYLRAADANQDGTVDISDATALQMYIAEYDLPYPIGEAITQ